MTSSPEAASQSLAVLTQLAVRIPALSGLNAAPVDEVLMLKGGDERRQRLFAMND